MSAFEPSQIGLTEVADARGDRIDLRALEKDYYLTEVFRLLMNFDTPEGVQFVFTGGTSLSKRGIISRFSEDADFLLVYTGEALASRKKRSNFRKALVAHLGERRDVCSAISGTARDDGRQIIIEIEYPSRLTETRALAGLRDHIRLELRYTNVLPPADVVAVRSLVAEVVSTEAPVSTLTLSPLVIAANKFVGLAWRVIKRERAGSEHNPEDRNLVRHVHDLAALLPTIEASADRFRELVRAIIASDRPRYRDLAVEPANLIATGAKLVTAEHPYRAEFERFVRNMSFAPIDEVIGYAEAMVAYKRIVGLVGDPD